MIGHQEQIYMILRQVLYHMKEAFHGFHVEHTNVVSPWTESNPSVMVISPALLFQFDETHARIPSTIGRMNNGDITCE